MKNLESKTTMENETMQEAIQLINEFYESEFCEYEHEDFSNLKEIGLAYTTSYAGDKIQVYANLIDFSIVTYVNGELAKEIVYSTLEELVNKELARLDFEGLVCDFMYETPCTVEDKELAGKIYDRATESDMTVTTEMRTEEIEILAEEIKELEGTVLKDYIISLLAE